MKLFFLPLALCVGVNYVKRLLFFLYLWYKNTLLVLTYTLLYLGERAERNLVIFYRPFCYSNLIYNMEIRSVSQSQHLICAHWKCVTALHFETFYPGSKPEIKTLFNVFVFSNFIWQIQLKRGRKAGSERGRWHAAKVRIQPWSAAERTEPSYMGCTLYQLS